MSIFQLWFNRLNPKFWELDIWHNWWAVFDTLFFGCQTMGVIVGTATFARQLHMAAEFTNPIDTIKGNLRPYRGVNEAIKDIWNTDNTFFLTWFLPICAYPTFKIDRLAPEKTIYKEFKLNAGKENEKKNL